DKLELLKGCKNIRRERIKDFADQCSGTIYTPFDQTADHSPQWDIKADCAFPCATQNEINAKDAQNLLKNGVFCVAEGANMPTSAQGVSTFLDAGILYAPGKASNAGGVATSGLEMSQNSMRLSWPREEVDGRLRHIMQSIHKACVDAAATYGTPGNYVNGANIAGFLKVANAMMDQGLV
ncbi:MAG: NADP-specific glutamate dehydrogenase, partial [Methanomassiliicoccales archaeon]|nr:NADP-specific glutamate dehydrogenase [Methanomassiliicoccales archaeon]